MARLRSPYRGPPLVVKRPDLLREGSRWRALRLLAKSIDGRIETYLFACCGPAREAVSEQASEQDFADATR